MSRQQRRSFLVFLGVVLATLVLAAQVRAGTQGSCSNPGDFGASLRIWENAQNDTSDGNDTWYTFCNVGSGASYTNLALVAHTLNGTCHSSTWPIRINYDNWNDCLDQATVWLPSSLWRVCFYIDTGHRRLSYYLTGSVQGGRYTIPPADNISSLYVSNQGTCP